jgi:hypothetical protein
MDDSASVHPSRLLEVADLVLEMIEAKGGALGLLDLATAPLAYQDSVPLPSQLELEEAVTLLIRMGFIERVDRSGGV